MREHQIIINLRPEHYQELERLSRVAGSRSVSIFVKERILASLGIATGAASAGAGSTNLTAVTADIRRLHRDLQVFVAESLSGKDFGYVSGDPSELVEHDLGDEGIADYAIPLGEEQPAQSASSAPGVPGLQASSQTAQALENRSPAESTSNAAMPPVPIYPGVSGAPRISPVIGNGAAPPSDQAIPRPKLPDFPITQPIPRVTSPFGPVPGASIPSMLPQPSAISQSAQSSSGQYPAQSSSGNYPAQPSAAQQAAPASAQHPAQQATQPPAQPPSLAAQRLAAPVPLTSMPNSAQLRTGPARDPNVPDDLEELAERAFAISPRLGAMDEIDDDKPMFSDPLDELLGDMDDDEPIVEPALPELPVAPVPKPAPTAQQQSRRPAPMLVEPSATTDPPKPDFAAEVIRLAMEAERTAAAGRDDDEKDADQTTGASAQDVDANELAIRRAVKQQSLTGANPALAMEELPVPPPDDDETTGDTAQGDSDSTSSDSGGDSAAAGEADQSTTQNPPPISGGPPPRRRRT